MSSWSQACDADSASTTEAAQRVVSLPGQADMMISSPLFCSVYMVQPFCPEVWHTMGHLSLAHCLQVQAVVKPVRVLLQHLCQAVDHDVFVAVTNELNQCFHQELHSSSQGLHGLMHGLEVLTSRADMQQCKLQNCCSLTDIPTVLLFNRCTSQESTAPEWI